MAGSEVVEEEQRLCPAHHQVVHAHGHEIDANRVVLAHEKGQLQLGAHAVGAGHQQRVLVVLGQRAQASEAAEISQDLGPHGALHVSLDAFNQRVARVDVDAGIAVGEFRLLAIGCMGHGQPPSPRAAKIYARESVCGSVTFAPA
jgi:hypothetical protein